MRLRFNAGELAAVVVQTLSSIDVRTTSVLAEGRWQNVMKDEQHSLGHRRGLSPGQDRLIEIREHNRPRVRGLPARRLHLSIVLRQLPHAHRPEFTEREPRHLGGKQRIRAVNHKIGIEPAD